MLFSFVVIHTEKYVSQNYKQLLKKKLKMHKNCHKSCEHN